jgi:predicted NUDIX family NTP pyrophosphohydrolase
MEKKSAGILLYRMKNKVIEFFLVHPGGPFFINKDLGSWSIPKGEFTESEDALDAATREFKEETGIDLAGNALELSPVKQKGGKRVFAWAMEADLDPEKISSNTFSLEWPPKSGKFRDYPEIDKGEWFSYPIAKQKINPAQILFIEELITKLNLPAEYIHGITA